MENNVNDLHGCSGNVEMMKLEEKHEMLERETFALQIESDSWSQVYGRLGNEIPKAKQLLRENERKIWDQREEFCQQADTYLEQYGLLSAWWSEKREQLNKFNIHQFASQQNKLEVNNKKMEMEISNLETNIKELEDEVVNVGREKEESDKELKEILQKHDELLSEPLGSAFDSIRESIEFSKDRCSQLSALIQQKELEIQMVERRLQEQFRQQRSLPMTRSTEPPQKQDTGLFSVVDMKRVRKFHEPDQPKLPDTYHVSAASDFRPASTFFKGCGKFTNTNPGAYEVYQTIEKSTVVYRSLQTAGTKGSCDRSEVKDIVNAILQQSQVDSTKTEELDESAIPSQEHHFSLKPV